MRPYRIILLAAVMLSVPLSCTVKEERSECPCCLKVASLTALPDNARAYFFKLSEAVGNGYIPASPVPYEAEYFVPKCLLEVCYVKKGGNPAPLHGDVIIPSGSQSDSVFAHRKTVNCLMESAADTLELHKQFATLSVSFKDCSDPVVPTVRGFSCGMEIPSLRPVAGAFNCTLLPDGKGRYSVRLPRQSDGSLAMDVYLPDGSLLTTIEVGMEIIASGYDWATVDLADIDMTLDLSESSVLIKVIPWLSGGQYGIDI